MIMQVALYAEGTLSRAPAILELYLGLTTWSPLNPPLPFAGGYMDQPAQLMKLMRVSHAVYIAWQTWSKLSPVEKSAKWRKDNPDLFAVVKVVRALLRPDLYRLNSDTGDNG